MTGTAGANEAEAQDPQEARVGVLGWLGFIIINFAIWGIITTASWIGWIIGFVICLLYTVGLIALALWLERRGGRYRQFVNLLWVLGCWFVFILGIYISVQVIGRLADGDDISVGSGSAPSPDASDPASLVPENASQELRDWAGGRTSASATFAAFNGSVFFGGRNGTAFAETLWYSAGGSGANQVLPELRGPQSFTEFRSDLYFFAELPIAGSQAGLWRVNAGEPGAAVPVFNSSKPFFRITSLFQDQDLLFFKANYEVNCPGACYNTWVPTLFQSNGSAEGTVDLMTDPCAAAEPCPSGGAVIGDEPPVAALWGVLFVATIPMVALASFILLRRKLPGPIVNVFGGVLCAVVTLYLIATYDNEDWSGLPSFLKIFITIYSSVLWVALVAWSLLSGTVSPWLEELKTWAVAIVGVTFFVVIHFDLEVPFTKTAWHWVVYGILAVFQLVISAAVSRTVPMVAGAIGIFVLAWKIAFEIVEFAGISGDELKMLTMLAILALQGIGIIAAAIYYAGNRDKVDGAVRNALTCGRSPQVKPDAEAA